MSVAPVGSVKPASDRRRPAPEGSAPKRVSRSLVHDGVITREQCGGPVVDATGKVVALNIATRVLDDTRTYAVPAAVARKAVEELRKQQPSK